MFNHDISQHQVANGIVSLLVEEREVESDLLGVAQVPNATDNWTNF